MNNPSFVAPLNPFSYGPASSIVDNALRIEQENQQLVAAYKALGAELRRRGLIKGTGGKTKPKGGAASGSAAKGQKSKNKKKDAIATLSQDGVFTVSRRMAGLDDDE